MDGAHLAVGDVQVEGLDSDIPMEDMTNMDERSGVVTDVPTISVSPVGFTLLGYEEDLIEISPVSSCR